MKTIHVIPLLLTLVYAQNGTVIRVDPLRCISIYGLETNLRNTVCSWAHPAEYYIEKLHEMGFNTLRIPFSAQYLVERNYDVLDRIIHKAEELHMQIVLDLHRIGNSYQEPDPDKGISESTSISHRDGLMNWMATILTRYFQSPAVIGINSWNEYTGMSSKYKHDWDKYVFDMVESMFPGRFLYFATGLLWSGILSGFSLEDLPYRDRIIYSVHKYHFSGTGDRADWEGSFGNAFPPHKMVVGEWGFRDPEDVWWGENFANYLAEKKIHNNCFWTIAHSGDTGGLWWDNCNDINYNKLSIIKKTWASPGQPRTLRGNETEVPGYSIVVAT